MNTSFSFIISIFCVSNMSVREEGIHAGVAFLPVGGTVSLWFARILLVSVKLRRMSPVSSFLFICFRYAVCQNLKYKLSLGDVPVHSLIEQLPFLYIVLIAVQKKGPRSNFSIA